MVERIAHYDVVAKLGEGGMGVVWKARDTRLNRFAALKLLPPGLARNEERRARFIQEAQAASALNHPNIITVYDIGREGDTDYIAMEFVDGQTLDAVIPPKGMKVAEALKYSVQIADALAAAHQAGIVHRDLKPSNIMVTTSGLVKVLDFGLAKLTAPENPSQAEATLTAKAITEQGAVIGTAAYMSPEQAEGKAVDRRSDIFSFGSVLYEMLSGQRAFAGDTRLALLSAIVNTDPKPIAALPADLNRTLRRCLRKDPLQRFQHMDDLKITLADLKQDSDSGILSDPAAAVVPKQRKVWPLIGLAAGIAAVSITAWLLNSRPRPAEKVQESVGAVRQLTFDSGLTTDPTYWTAGKMVAYASDRATGSNLDIWVQQIGGESRQLTNNDADDHEPDFSPDGTRIVFRSEREGGGLYIVPTLGGTERRISTIGSDPHFSPDGQFISYWVGTAPRISIGRSFIVPTAGGEPREVAPEMNGVSRVVWSADGKHLLFMARSKGVEVFVQPAAGGKPEATGFIKAVRTLDPSTYASFSFHPVAWHGSQILFSGRSGDATNIFSIDIDPETFKVGRYRRLTAGTGIEYKPVVADHQLIFASTNQNDDVWMLPFDSAASKSTGPPVRVTTDLGSDIGCSVSADGSRIAWYSLRSQEAHVMTKDFKTGRVADLISVRRSLPLSADISPDGQRISYNDESGTPPVSRAFVMSVNGGNPQKICDDCRSRDWLGSDALMISQAQSQRTISVLDLRTRSLRAIGPSISGLRGATDGKWWVGYLPSGRGSSKIPTDIFAAPVLPDRSVTEADFIPVTKAEGTDYLPAIAPDGKSIVFLSPRDGFHCIWGQKIDGTTHRPIGQAFPISHAHTARNSPAYVGGGMRRLSVGRDKVVFTMAERTGNIWIADLPR